MAGKKNNAKEMLFLPALYGEMGDWEYYTAAI